MKSLITSSIILLAFAATLFAQDAKKADSDQKAYLVKTTHTTEQCLQALTELKDSKNHLLDKMYFGCMHGDHTSYGFMHGSSEADVRAMLPASMQNTATVTPVAKVTAKQIAEYHKK